jgi:hypothetical protein
MVHILLVETGLWLDGDEVNRACACLDEAHTLCDAARFPLGWANVALWRGRLAAQSDWTEARAHLETSLRMCHTLGTVAGVAERLEGLVQAIVWAGEDAEGNTNGACVAVQVSRLATRARDGAPALRSPGEHSAYTQFVEQIRRFGGEAATNDLRARSTGARSSGREMIADDEGILLRDSEADRELLVSAQSFVG